ncbi:MAG: hypothetical protein EP326_09295 [Deltaproteobacteria bacterium]|nr:MAG: hypothetical protein EP326_09295 [Deltaproteobacteria bacterium]
MKTLMTTILTLMIFGTANAASVDTYASAVNYRTNCERLIELWDVTSDSVTNNELYLGFDDAEAICDNESFTLRYLVINNTSGNDLNIAAVNEDFGKRQFQIVRRYGNPNSITTNDDGETVLNYLGSQVDVSFSVADGTVEEIHLDFKRALQMDRDRQNRDRARVEELKKRKRDGMNRLIEIFKNNLNADVGEKTRSGYIQDTDSCKLILKTTGTNHQNRDYTETHTIDLIKFNFSKPDGIWSVMKVKAGMEKIRNYTDGDYAYDNWIYFNSPSQVQTFRNVLMNQMASICK